jgi:hypothetical protein
MLNDIDSHPSPDMGSGHLTLPLDKKSPDAESRRCRRSVEFEPAGWNRVLLEDAVS